MTRRRVGLGLAGGGVFAVGWAMGAPALALPGFALFIVAVLSRIWRIAVQQRVKIERRNIPLHATEGDAVRYDIELRGAGLVPGSLTFLDTVGGVAVGATRLRRRGQAITTVELDAVHRGLHTVGPGELTIADPLGVEQVRVQIEASDVRLLVRPAIPVLDRTFLDVGGTGNARHRAEVRIGGTEPHGIREHRSGESLRAVHWASSARQGRLMVRELEEPPDIDLTIILDLDASGVVGSPGQSSLDTAVRAAGGLVLSHSRRQQRIGLVLAGNDLLRFNVTDAATWLVVLDALAAAQGVAGVSLSQAIRAAGPGLVLVTTRSVGPLVDDLLARRAAGVVAIDAPTFAGAGSGRPDTGLLRLAAHGVPVAVLRAGDGLAPLAIHSSQVREAAHG